MPTITLPGGYRPEEGKGPGDEVQALVTMRIGSDGMSAELVEVDGAKFSAEPAVVEEEVVEEEVVAPGGDEAFESGLDKALVSMRM